MQRPVGVLVDGSTVYVVDSRRHVIDVFDLSGATGRSCRRVRDGRRRSTSRRTPRTSNIYVTDRAPARSTSSRPRASTSSDFDPKLPKNQLPDFDTKRRAVGAGGARVRAGRHDVRDRDPQRPSPAHLRPERQVQEVGRHVGHRSNEAEQGAGGLPVPERARGPARRSTSPTATTGASRSSTRTASSSGSSSPRACRGHRVPRHASRRTMPRRPQRFVVVDTLAHDGTIWSAEGEKLAQLRQQGVLEGQFSYPNGVVGRGAATRSSSPTRPTVASRSGAGPSRSRRSRSPRIPQNWVLCLLPLLLLPLLLLLPQASASSPRRTSCSRWSTPARST